MSDRRLTEFGPGKTGECSLKPGDICIAATWREGEVDIRRNVGAGRILILDSDLTPKGALWTGETGLVTGLGWNAATGLLYATDTTSRSVSIFDDSGQKQSAPRAMQGKPFGPVAFAGDFVFMGDHIKGEKPPFIGEGAIHVFDKEGNEAAVCMADHDPGKFGFHGVTNMVPAGDGSEIIYISETGARIMRYNLAADKQLDDLAKMPEDMPTAGLARLADGRLLLSHVYGVSMLSGDGTLLRCYEDIPAERGLAALCLLADESAFLIANFFTGLIEKRSVETGELLDSLETGMVFGLTSMVEITGPES